MRISSDVLGWSCGVVSGGDDDIVLLFFIDLERCRSASWKYTLINAIRDFPGCSRHAQ
jgi:hypothetical protein